jgi:hypothetical protein
MARGTHPIGTGWHKARTAAESGPTKGTGSNPSAVMAKVGDVKRGSSMQSEAGFGHKGQPKGDSAGAGQKGNNLRGMPRGGDAHIFPASPSNASSFESAKQSKVGKLRMSGMANAHRIGCK